jgi:hypothetical protein
MILGIDFDNTIVCYDGIFHRVALERGLIPEELPQDKTTVRDQLRRQGLEEVWIEMQGYVYGPRLIDAQPYPGMLDFFRAAVQQGVDVRIISHKTRHPFRGEQHDLHAAAWGWLEANGFFDPARIGIRRDHVFLELTKEAKHQRIGSLGCTHFIDDLPEILLDPGFPNGVERIHFDPCLTAKLENGLRSAGSWKQISTELLASPAVISLAHQVLGEAPVKLAGVTGGANNRIHHALGTSGEVMIKAYHHNPSDRRDRFAAEKRFYQLDLPQTANPLAWDAENRLGAFSVIHGRKLATEEITATDVDQCIEWVCTLQTRREHPAAQNIALAADACPTMQDHAALLQRRVERLLKAESDHAAFRAFVTDELAPHSEKVIATMDSTIATPPRVLSPSDFGFHNALKDVEGRLWFLDFEYAGWDDAAKLLCDYFCQPQVPMSIEHAERFVSAMTETTGEAGLGDRFRLLLPLHAAKWACILLNEFLKTDADRRKFAGLHDRRDEQLEKSRRMLQKSVSHL